MTNNNQEWELCKENAAPLAQGRNVQALSRALDPTKASLKPCKEDDSEMQYFESLVRPSECFSQIYVEQLAKRNEKEKDGSQRDNVKYAIIKSKIDKDPLVHWLRYIHYLEETYPSDTNAVFLLRERCTRALINHPNYANDPRFVRNCVLYADRTHDPNDVFKFYHQSKVGSSLAMFWMAWAWVAEKNKDFSFAEKIFRKALRKKPKPLQLLEQRYKQFQRRMSRHWLNAAKKYEDGLAEDEEDEIDQENRRGALDGLTQEGVIQNHRARATNTMAAHSSANNQNQGNTGVNGHSDRDRSRDHTSNRDANNSKAGFNIFVDKNEDYDGEYNLDQTIHPDTSNPQNAGRQLAKDEDRKKENVIAAERWNERGGLYNTSQRSSAYDMRHGESNITNASAASVANRWVGVGIESSRMAGGTSSGPKFEVFVDEEIALENEKNLAHHKDGNIVPRDALLRQRVEEGVADKLIMDPLKFVRNPLKVVPDKTKVLELENKCKAKNKGSMDGKSKPNERKEDKRDIKKISKTRNDLTTISCGFSKSLVAKGADGQESCFEEGRKKAQYFHLKSPTENFNLLEREVSIVLSQPHNSYMDIDENSQMDDEEIDSNQVYNRSCDNNASLHSAYNEINRNEEKEAMTRRVLFEAKGTNSDLSNFQNTSTVSSNINDDDAVGVIGDREETINTKFAYKELSMMFSSPVIDSSTKKLIKQNISDGSIQPLFSVHSKKRPNHCNNSDEKKDASRNLKSLKRGVSFKIINDSKPDIENDENLAPTNPDARTNTTRGFRSCALQPLSHSMVEDEDRESKILRNHNKEDCPTSNEGIAIEIKKAQTSDFQIFCDENNSEEKEDEQDKVEDAIKDNCVGFTIFEDTEEDDNNGMSVKEADDGDTASLDDIVSLMKNLSEIKKEDDPRSDSAKPISETKIEKEGFSIFCDDEIKEDQITISPKVLNEKRKSQRCNNFCHVERDEDFASCSAINDGIDDTGAFGNISLIQPDDPDTAHHIFEDPNAIEYAKMHDNQLVDALKKLLKTNDHLTIYDRQSELLPKSLCKGAKLGTIIDMGGCELEVKNELGTGAYGTVLLCSSLDNSSFSGQDIALKFQKPTGSLAFEYEILKTIEKRNSEYEESLIKTRSSRRKTKSKSISYHQFPKALSFIGFKNGGILGMTAGSSSGVNLIDIVNIHHFSVPELIAIYYTSRMLMHLETLHFCCNILHCDVKPDNWVLTLSESSCNNDSKASMPGSDLMLVDFGRSIDLKPLSVNSKSPLDIQFCGNATTKDMESVRMRDKKAWGTDIDTFGLCASSHVLLFGCHIEIEKDRANQRWRPVKKLRRYWQRDLWCKFFDILLNVEDYTSGITSCENLRTLRSEFENYLNEGSHRSELKALLNAQSRSIPKRKSS